MRMERDRGWGRGLGRNKAEEIGSTDMGERKDEASNQFPGLRDQ